MAAPTLQEILIGGFGYFVENGLTVDAQTVAATVKPDTVPTTNWTDATLGTILDFKFGNEKLDSPFMRPLPSGESSSGMKNSTRRSCVRCHPAAMKR